MTKTGACATCCEAGKTHIRWRVVEDRAHAPDPAPSERIEAWTINTGGDYEYATEVLFCPWCGTRVADMPPPPEQPKKIRTVRDLMTGRILSQTQE